MKLLIIGNDQTRAELVEKIGAGHELEEVRELEHVEDPLNTFDAIFDLQFDDYGTLDSYENLEQTALFVGAVKTQLAAAAFEADIVPSFPFIGINTLPTFINRTKTEVSFFNEASKNAATQIAQQLGWDLAEVRDRVGMATPRTVLMIINEACYTVQEGTASIVDIDLGMKLGTNYPKGPFEWADAIGIEQVYETLEALYEDTKDERYKICPLLKTKYLTSESFH